MGNEENQNKDKNNYDAESEEKYLQGIAEKNFDESEPDELNPDELNFEKKAPETVAPNPDVENFKSLLKQQQKLVAEDAANELNKNDIIKLIGQFNEVKDQLEAGTLQNFANLIEKLTQFHEKAFEKAVTEKAASRRPGLFEKNIPKHIDILKYLKVAQFDSRERLDTMEHRNSPKP